MDKIFPGLAKFTAVFQAFIIQIIEDFFSKVAESEKYLFHAAVLSVNWTNKQNIIASSGSCQNLGLNSKWALNLKI